MLGFPLTQQVQVETFEATTSTKMLLQKLRSVQPKENTNHSHLLTAIHGGSPQMDGAQVMS